jgi:hypothetical protein
LGTTFTVLNSSGLAASRLGVVLTSAAMMDDVVGLVMVQVISNLGGDDFSWVTVVRPVLVSIAFAVVAPLVCLYIARPLTFSLNRCRENHLSAGFDNFMRKSSTAFAIHTLILLGLITGATYAGTSNLFAAYIAGASISWWDSEVPHVAMERTTQREEKREQTASATLTSAAEQSPSERPDNNVQAAHSLSESANGASSNLSPKVDEEERNVTSGSFIYEHYYHPAVSKILQPLFFASVGFSIPITKMFKGSIVWRGIVYTVLMAIGKLVCGLWLVRFSAQRQCRSSLVKAAPYVSSSLMGKERTEDHNIAGRHARHCADSLNTGVPSKQFGSPQLSQSCKTILSAPSAHSCACHVRAW